MTVTKEAINAAALRLRDETGGFGNEDDRAVAEQMLEAALPFLSSRSAEAGKPVVKERWRVFESVCAGEYGIEVADDADADAILPPRRIAREYLDDIVSRFNAASVSTPADSEPVAWRYVYDDVDGARHRGCSLEKPTHHDGYPVLHLDALYAAPVADREPVSVPEGWVLVPKTPTQSMLDAGALTVTGACRGVKSCWSEMLAAAPQPNPSTVDATRLLDLIRWAHDTLYEINPSNYDHDEVCKLNDASVEVILGLAAELGEKHGKSDDWWAARAALAAQGEKP